MTLLPSIVTSLSFPDNQGYASDVLWLPMVPTNPHIHHQKQFGSAMKRLLIHVCRHPTQSPERSFPAPTTATRRERPTGAPVFVRNHRDSEFAAGGGCAPKELGNTTSRECGPTASSLRPTCVQSASARLDSEEWSRVKCNASSEEKEGFKTRCIWR